MSNTGHKKVEDILMRRDGISRQDAKDQIEQCIEALEAGELDALEYYLGLEDDYIYDLI